MAEREFNLVEEANSHVCSLEAEYLAKLWDKYTELQSLTSQERTFGDELEMESLSELIETEEKRIGIFDDPTEFG